MLIWERDQARQFAFGALSSGVKAVATVSRSLDGHTAAVRSLRVIRQQRPRIVSASHDNTIKVWDLVTPNKPWTVRDTIAHLADFEDLGAPTGYLVNIMIEDDDTIRRSLRDVGLVVLDAAADPRRLVDALRGEKARRRQPDQAAAGDEHLAVQGTLAGHRPSIGGRPSGGNAMRHCIHFTWSQARHASEPPIWTVATEAFNPRRCGREGHPPGWASTIPRSKAVAALSNQELHADKAHDVQLGTWCTLERISGPVGDVNPEGLRR